jgi:hypothetical protein
MKSPEQFLATLSRSSHGAALSSTRRKPLLIALRTELQQTANRGIQIFPVPGIAQWTGQTDLLIREATVEISRLEELAEMYPLCTWRGAVGLSRICVVRLEEPAGRAWFAAKNEDQEGCRTLSIMRLVLREAAKSLGPGATILTDGDSFPVPPSRGSNWADPSAEIEEVPYWLRVMAFEPPDSPPGRSAQMPIAFPRPVPCRSRARHQKPFRNTLRRDSNFNRATWRWGWHVYRRR